VIALRSPHGVLKRDCNGPPEKGRQRSLRGKVGHFSGRFRAKFAELRHFERFCGDWSHVSLQFRLRGGESEIRTFGTFVWSTKRRPVRNIQPILQHTRLLRELLQHANREEGPFSCSAERRTPSDYRTESRKFWVLLRQIGSYMTACLPRSQSENLSAGCARKRQINEDFRWVLSGFVTDFVLFARKQETLIRPDFPSIRSPIRVRKV